jgi:hypothetical protein
MWYQQTKYFDSLCVGAPMVLMMGLKGTPPLWTFGSLYSLGGLDPCGCSHLEASLESEDLLMRGVVFLSVGCVGSLVSFLYTGSSSRAVTFCVLSVVLRTTVALPLSAGRTVKSALPCSM